MIYLGKKKPGSTVYVPFHTFDSNDPSASVTITGLAATDIEVYKDGGTTQRASVSGYTLLDTDGIDFDGVTGIHGFTIDLADNDTANFWEAGSTYIVVVASITVDAATINFVPVMFEIGYEGAILDTVMATLASQTSFTLEEGPADNDALNGCIALVHDLASAVQVAIGVVSDYVGSTKTVTLAADPGIFTMAAGDNVSFFPPANVQYVAGTAQTAGDIAALITTVDEVVDSILEDTDLIDDGTSGLAKIATDVAAILMDTAEIGAAGAGLTAVPWNANWDAEVQSEVNDGLVAFFTSAAALVDLIFDEPISGHTTAKTWGALLNSMQFGTVSAAVVTPATTEIGSDDITEATADHYIGRTIIFLSGALRYQATDITDYAQNTGEGHFTFTALTEAPADNDTFVVV